MCIIRCDSANHTSAVRYHKNGGSTYASDVGRGMWRQLMVRMIHTLRNVIFAPLKCAGAAPDILTCAAVISVNVAVTADTKTATKNGTARSIVFMVIFIDAQHL